MKKIQNLINQLFEETKKGKDAFKRNMEIKEDLVRFCAEIFSPALEKLRALKKENSPFLSSKRSTCGSPVFHLIDAMTQVSEPKHAKDLAEILLWEEIAVQGKDRSQRCILLDAIGRNGDKTVIPLLQEFAEKVKRVYYEEVKGVCYADFEDRDPETGELETIPAEMYYKWDQEEIVRTIAACQAR